MKYKTSKIIVLVIFILAVLFLPIFIFYFESFRLSIITTIVLPILISVLQVICESEEEKERLERLERDCPSKNIIPDSLFYTIISQKIDRMFKSESRTNFDLELYESIRICNIDFEKKSDNYFIENCEITSPKRIEALKNKLETEIKRIQQERTENEKTNIYNKIKKYLK